MPHKFNAARRHKFDKAQYRVINWAEYNESLRQRGDLTIWVSDEAQSVWSAPRRTSRGGQRRYSDLAIETCLTLRTAYRLGLRQTQGLMGSIGTLMGLDIRVPDFSTLSGRANGLSIAQAMRQAGSVPAHLVVDSTGWSSRASATWTGSRGRLSGGQHPAEAVEGRRGIFRSTRSVSPYDDFGRQACRWRRRGQLRLDYFLRLSPCRRLHLPPFRDLKTPTIAVACQIRSK